MIRTAARIISQLAAGAAALVVTWALVHVIFLVLLLPLVWAFDHDELLARIAGLCAGLMAAGGAFALMRFIDLRYLRKRFGILFFGGYSLAACWATCGAILHAVMP